MIVPSSPTVLSSKTTTGSSFFTTLVFVMYKSALYLVSRPIASVAVTTYLTTPLGLSKFIGREFV